MTSKLRSTGCLQRQTQAGFSLVEIAIVLVIIGLLLASVAGPLGSYKANDRYQATQQYLEHSRQALLVFAAARGYLPCPDTDNDGAENRSASKECDDAQGMLPFLDLGLEAETAWGDVPGYIVHGRAETQRCAPATANEAECFFSRSDGFNFATKAGNTGKLNITDADANDLVTQGIALVVSYGGNAAETRADCTANVDALERENCDGDTDFIHTFHRTGDTNRYDDQLIWLDQLAVKGALIGN